MITRPLTKQRFELYRAHTPTIDEPELIGFYGPDRIFTKWMYTVFGNGLIKFSRVAYDYRGPDSYVGDCFDLATVFYAPESACWSYKVRTQLGHRSGDMLCEVDKSVFPVRSLSMADAHVLGGMAHDRFCVGSLTEERLDCPLRLPRIDGNVVVLPWTRRHLKNSGRVSSGHLEYHRFSIFEPGSGQGGEIHPMYSRRRLGSGKAVRMVNRMGSNQAATVKGVGYDLNRVYQWSVSTPSLSSAGESARQYAAFVACDSLLNALDSWVPPTVLDLEDRLQEDAKASFLRFP